MSPYYYGYGIAFYADSLFVQADAINGTTAADWMHGRGGNDTMNGVAGDDTLDGGSGTDSLAGGAGDDVYVVDNALDVVVEAANAGNDTVALSVYSYSAFTYTLANNVENVEINPVWVVVEQLLLLSGHDYRQYARQYHARGYRQRLSQGNGGQRPPVRQ